MTRCRLNSATTVFTKTAGDSPCAFISRRAFTNGAENVMLQDGVMVICVKPSPGLSVEAVVFVAPASGIWTVEGGAMTLIGVLSRRFATAFPAGIDRKSVV